MSSFEKLPTGAKIFVVSTAVLGFAAAGIAVALRPPAPELRTVLFVLLASGAGFVRMRLPVFGTLSLSYAFILATLMGFGLGPSVLAGIVATLASGLVAGSEGKKPPLHRTLFNTGVVGLAATLSGLGYLAAGGQVGVLELPGGLVSVLAYTGIFSVLNIGLIAMVVDLSGKERIGRSLLSNYGWSIPGYVAGSSMASVLVLLRAHQNPALLLLLAPFVYLVHLTYSTRTEKLEEQQRHTQQTAELYLSVTQALALAVEAKDENTEEHLHRVQQYCLGIGEILGLSVPEIEALRAASLLHDIGKIAVPEYVLTKPGRLTDEEMEIMKIHPCVGADILGAVPFPYPLAPIVRHHHERWDGTGYPDGIEREQIPLGSRILTVVDCYDALTSDRPYRKAVSNDEAVEFLQDQAGRMFDPRIVSVLIEHLDALEKRVEQAERMESSIPPDGVSARPAPPPDDEAEPEPALLHELTALVDDLERRAAPPSELAELLDRVGELVPYRTMVVYVLDEKRENLVVGYVEGQGAGRLRDLTIPVGEQQAGWAVLHQRPYRGRAHINPLQRDGSRFDLEELPAHPDTDDLCAAVVAPLTSETGRIGVIGLYHGEELEYDDTHVTLLTRIAGQLSRVLPRADEWPLPLPTPAPMARRGSSTTVA